VTDSKHPKLTLFKLYLGTAEKVSDRRAHANIWMLSVNSAVVTLYGYLQADKGVVGAFEKAVWLCAIPAAGMIVCVAWGALLSSYSKLNRAKFAVLSELEKKLLMGPFTLERESYKADKRRSLSQIERLIPACFALPYAVMLAATLITWKIQ
jgi:hypothetical protein